MPNWNPSAPEVLGNEWFSNIGLTARVWAGAPPGMARLQSTAAETIISLGMSATVNHLLQESAPTLVDIIEEGNESIPLFKMASLVPNGDGVNDGWTTNTGGTTNLHLAVNEDVTKWGAPSQSPARADWIQTTGTLNAYSASVDASSFAAGGANQNARIGWVAVQAIHGANTGFRKIDTKLAIAGDTWAPAGSGLRDVHGFGAIYQYWWGEINPATGKPWLPADIAAFGPAGTSRLWIRSHGTVTTAQYPLCYAIRLHVHYQPVENRVAVGVWRRPEDLPDRLVTAAVGAGDIITLPGGAANWSKLSGRNYLFYWRQSVSPSEYGAVVADDIRWNYIRQHLGPKGQPPNYAPPPGGILALDGIAHDQFGRPEHGFVSDGTSAAAIALGRSDLGTSIDSQPYRLDLTDLEEVTTTQKLGQRITPGTSTSYLGVRFVIVPPDKHATDPTLTVTINRVSDSVQMGGTFTITAAACRVLPVGIGGWRYVTGFLSSGAALVSGTAYEIRFTTSAHSGPGLVDGDARLFAWRLRLVSVALPTAPSSAPPTKPPATSSARLSANRTRPPTSKPPSRTSPSPPSTNRRPPSPTSPSPGRSPLSGWAHRLPATNSNVPSPLACGKTSPPSPPRPSTTSPTAKSPAAPPPPTGSGRSAKTAASPTTALPAPPPPPIPAPC